ncbi:NUDIX domain-containing protein [Candidatus Daviesbacteria bacterium]|nr:NUDIX domain-containing protein [Candidatus Daviesbacteria bacterium]
MDKQIILAVDDSGKFLEYIPKEVGHTGKGRCHLAITMLLYNSKGEVLLQKRKHQIFDNIWDLTGATHPLHKADGSDETLEEAILRCLREEWKIDKVENLKRAGVFNYFAKYGDLCENEHCFFMVGKYDGKVYMDPNVGYEYKWTNEADFLKDIEQNPQNYTPWAQEAVELLTR